MARRKYPITIKQERGIGSLKQERPDGIFRIYFTTPEGNTGKKTTHTNVMDEAIGVFDRWIEEQKAGRWGIHQPQFKPVQLKEMVQYHLAEKKDRVSDKHYFYEESTWEKKILPFFGENTYLGSISEEQIDAYCRLQKKRGLSSSAINHELQWIGQIFKLAIRKKWLPETSKPYIEKVSHQTRLPNILKSPEEIQNLLAVAKNHSHHMFLFISLAVYTGMRAGEILKLNWEDIDLKDALLYVRDPKNKYDRIVHLSKTLYTLLEEASQGMTKKSPVIVNPRTGKRLQSYKTAWTTIRQQAGIPTEGLNRIRFHDLRHSFATLNYANGADIKVIKDLIGHRKIESTMIYTHIVDQVQKNAIENFDKLLQNEDKSE